MGTCHALGGVIVDGYGLGMGMGTNSKEMLGSSVLQDFESGSVDRSMAVRVGRFGRSH